MPIREVRDNAYATGNSTAPSTGTGKPFQPVPRLEPYDAIVLDATVAGFVPVGTFVVEQMTAANGVGGSSSCGANYLKSAAANQAIGTFHHGVVVSPAGANANNASGLANQATPGQSQARITQVGDCLALVQSTANANKAIAVGDPLCADGAGNLTSAPATPAAGTVVAFAKVAIAGGTAAALAAVTMGGY